MSISMKQVEEERATIAPVAGRTSLAPCSVDDSADLYLKLENQPIGSRKPHAR
jgi:hypothetical protein